MDLQKNYVLSSWCFQLFLQKAYAVGCPSTCGMVSVQGEESFSPCFLALKIKIGRDMTTVKKILLQNQDEGNWAWKTENQRNKKNGQVAEGEVQAHHVLGDGGGEEWGL